MKIYLAAIVEIVDLVLRAVIDCFEIYTINSLIKKKIETKFIMSKDLFRVAQPEQNKKNTINIIEEKKVLAFVNHVFNQISSFKREPLFKTFTISNKRSCLKTRIEKMIYVTQYFL